METSHLELAERHVRRGRDVVSRQRAIVRQLARRSRPTTNAEALLVNLEQMLALMVAHRDRLRALPAEHQTAEQADRP